MDPNVKKAWKRWTGVLLTSLVLAAVAVPQHGCLTPAQRAAMVKYEKALADDGKLIIDLKAEAMKYRQELADLVAKVKAKELPAAEALALAEKVQANLSSTMDKIAKVEENRTATQAAIDEMRKNESPWWAYVLPAIPPLLSIGAAFVPGLGPIAAAGAQVAQLGSRLATAQNRVEALTEVGASLSRSLDEVVATAPPEVQPALAARKQELMLREQSGDEVAVKADYDWLRAEARKPAA